MTIEEALQLVENRKDAVFGPAAGAGIEVTPTGSFEQRALYGGFDIDPDELDEISGRAAQWFCNGAPSVGLMTLFRACWVDAFLVGLMVGQNSSPTTNLTSDTEVTGEGEAE